jgi:hypothetical protein
MIFATETILKPHFWRIASPFSPFSPQKQHHRLSDHGFVRRRGGRKKIEMPQGGLLNTIVGSSKKWVWVNTYQYHF